MGSGRNKSINQLSVGNNILLTVDGLHSHTSFNVFNNALFPAIDRTSQTNHLSNWYLSLPNLARRIIGIEQGLVCSVSR